MKKLLIIFCFLTIIVAGCRYKEGPLISLRSVENRIKGTWKIIEFTSDDVDSLQFFIDSCGNKMEIGKIYFDDTDYKIGFGEGKIKFGGSIYFINNKKEMKVSFGDHTYFKVIGPFMSNVISYWKILKLTKSDLKITVDFNNRNYNILFKKE